MCRDTGLLMLGVARDSWLPRREFERVEPAAASSPLHFPIHARSSHAIKPPNGNLVVFVIPVGHAGAELASRQDMTLVGLVKFCGPRDHTD
jgi:hypothetical protein